MATKTVRAIAKLRAGPGLELTEVPVPTPEINDVLIKIKRSAFCGTDVHIFNWDAWALQTIKPPMVTGHEFVGEIAGVGSNVQGFKAGDLVDVSRENLHDVQREIGMKEGFDVGLEMSGSPRALNDMIDNMYHGGRIALLGIMPET
jgi:threonine dehydrogenase-like Zn-dependent dehydrogenase